jgi:hypothetical protein
VVIGGDEGVLQVEVYGETHRQAKRLRRIRGAPFTLRQAW